MARYNDNDPPGSQNPTSAAPPVPPTLNSPPPPLPPGFTQRPTATTATSDIVRPDAQSSGTFDATAPKGYVDVTGTAASTSDATPTIQRPTPPGTFNGRTYSGAELDNLAARVNTIPSENFTRPAVGTLGIPVSPDQGVRIAALSIPRPTAQASPGGDVPQPFAIERPGSYDPTGAARDYRTDIASILNKDPRSTLGTAAWNAYVDSIGNGRQGAVSYQNKVGALLGAVKGTFDSQNQAGNANARDQTAWADNANTNTTNVSRSGLLANSRLGAADARADAMNYGADTRADAARYVADARANTPKIDAAADAAFSRAYQAALQNGATEDEARAAAGKVRLDLLRLRQQGVPGAQSPDDQQSPSSPAAPRGGQPSSALQQPQQPLLQPPAAAIGFLRANPHFYDQFDAKYGKGAAAQYLRAQ